MPIRFSVTEYMRGESEEILDVDFWGSKIKIFVEISLTKRRLVDIGFTFNIGSARFSENDARYYLSGPKADYTIQIKTISAVNLLADFEAKLAPYIDKFKNKLVSREEADKIYDGLVDKFQENLRNDLIYMKNLFDVEVVGV